MTKRSVDLLFSISTNMVQAHKDFDQSLRLTAKKMKSSLVNDPKARLFP